MKRGWRNDPAWVTYYEKRDRERDERRMALIKAEIEIEMNQQMHELSMRRLLEKPLAVITGADSTW